jgi:glutamyl-tRNA reductase
MRLALIHRALGAAPAPHGSTAWRTCLREIHFLPAHRLSSSEPDVLTDADAYALLLEVVCGLRSPLIGETEVQAQFKEFLASIDGRQKWLLRVGQRVLGDAKRIRSRHLQGFGAHSYGRLAAPHLLGRRVAVVGTGALAAQVIQSATEESTVDVWGRHAGRLLPVRTHGLNFSLIADAPRCRRSRPEPTTLAVAAPVAAEPLNAIASCYTSLLNIVDLRSADQQTAIDHPAPVVSLADLLAEASRTGDDGGPRVRAARADIQDLARAFAGREQLRPCGWDDVCA